MRTNPLKSLLIAGIAALSFANSSASAAIAIVIGNNPQPREQNILLKTGSGTTVSGTTNASGISVNFTSLSGQTLIANSSGHAAITTNDNGGLLTSVEVSSPGNAFKDFSASPQTSGFFTVTVKANDSTFTASLLGGPENDFITVVAQGNETIFSVTFTSSAGFTSLAQLRVSASPYRLPNSRPGR